MQIVADENMPLVRELFSAFGDVRLLPGRKIGNADLRDADALLVRSVTRVDESLLRDSPVRFVGSATIGTDHIDRAYLQQRAIRFDNAPGCNAQAVAEYVLSALLLLIDEHRFDPHKDSIGIVGFGNVGKCLAALLDVLRWPYVLNDPPLQSAGFQHPLMVDKAAILCCKVISLHTPLTREGLWPSYHWLAATEFKQLHHQTIINACRGPVVDNHALNHWLQQDDENCAVLDVWEKEPDVDPDLLKRVRLATPHIAGYSVEGKTNGSYMVHEAFCRYFSLPDQSARWRLAEKTMDSSLPAEPQQRLATIARYFYDIRNDDMRLRHALSTSSDRPHTFDQLRKNYPERRECGREQLRRLLSA